MKKIYLATVFIFLIVQYSCINAADKATPEIMTAEYEIRNYNQSEQGFAVFMVINHLPENCRISSIILRNKRFDNIITTQMNESDVFIDQFFPVNSQLLSDFTPPQTDSRTDGIVFEMECEKIFKEINFNLKTVK